MNWHPEEPYDALPHLPPKVVLESHKVLKATIEARSALARLDAAAQRLPNPAVVINAIPLLEAQASSAIENIVTTTDELFAADAAANDQSPETREALRYRSALRQGFEEISRRPITASTAERICSQIRNHDVKSRTTALMIGDPVSRRRIYTPPAAVPTLQALLDNWTRFVNRDLPGSKDLDPIVRMAVAHYQFEAIHPFTDGNGRTGRILNVLMLCDSSLMHLPLLYLSREIIATKDEYYRLLLAVTADGAWEEWLYYMITQVQHSADRTFTLIERLSQVEADLTNTSREQFGIVNADLVNVLMEQPYARARDVIARTGVSRPTATKWLKSLASAGVLSELRVGRDVLYVNRQMLAVLTS